MKKILGLDLGSTSIGWAFVHEAENEHEKTEIVGAGVRIVSLTTDEIGDFSKGQAISTNQERTLKRGARRGLQRYKLRRYYLLSTLKNYGIIDADFVLAENGLNTTFSSWSLRSKAASEKIELNDFARVLFMINKKRGYKSSRKATNSDGEDVGTAVDNVELALKLQAEGITPGQYLFRAFVSNPENKSIPEFYASDLMLELEHIIRAQQKFHEVLDEEFLQFFLGSNSKSVCNSYVQRKRNLTVAELPKSRSDKRKLYLETRSNALSEKVDLGVLLWVLCDIKGEIDNSSGYLGAISDRSKILRVNNQTIGQFMLSQLSNNKHRSTKNTIFYRQDYIDEFNRIWDKQAEFHPQLKNDDIKKEIRDVVIFYQRKLKSQKHLISDCEFAVQVMINHPSQKGVQIPMKKKVVPKSSPLFQEYRLLQNLNNLVIVDTNNPDVKMTFGLVDGENDNEIRNKLLGWLNIKEKLTKKEILQILGVKDNGDFQLNYEEIVGNRTRANFIHCILKIFEDLGHDKVELNLRKDPREFESDLNVILNALGLPENLLVFEALKPNNELDKQLYYRIWHLLYSAEEDAHIKEELIQLLNIPNEWLGYFYKLKLEADYGSISAWAIRKVLPYLLKGETIDKAAELHSQNEPRFTFKHSLSQTREELDNRVLIDELPLFKKGSLRNPVVEKVMNQLVNVVNAIIKDDKFGKPDEVRIEMARDLKASNEERDSITKSISNNQKRNESIVNTLKSEFSSNLGKRITKNDILRYKLWLECNKTSIYTGKPISISMLFSNEIDIEHILPKSRIFNDSFANKTLCERKINEEKGNDTAMSYMEKQSPEVKDAFLKRINELYKLGFQKGFVGISKAKFENLKLTNDKIPNDFISRQLQETRYISRKATQHLSLAIRNVTFTTGTVTQRLREDWGIVDVLKELNWDKFSHVEGATYYEEGKNGERLKRIKDWSKRNDHRHHAMDAITVALTKQQHIQFLNTLNAQSSNEKKLNNMFSGILDDVQKSKFKVPIENLRQKVRATLENIIISHKSKNKVTTPNVNRIKTSSGKLIVTKGQDTPRGQLHKETIYGRSLEYTTRYIKLTEKTELYEIQSISNQKYRELVLERLSSFNGDIKMAFGGKNSLKKVPIYIDSEKAVMLPEKIKITEPQERFTIRKKVDKDLKLEKVVDTGIRKKLQDRLDKFEGKSELAFSNLDENPIWLNEKDGIPIKSVKIYGVSNAIALHHKKNHHGDLIVDNNGFKIPTDFVNTGNNHHVAIYRDENGDLQEEVVSLFEAVQRKNSGLPVINKKHEKGWEFLFSMKQNELFVFPNTDFDVETIDFSDVSNYSQISKHCYRVQKFSTKYYVFRHHLETQINTDIKDVTFKRIQSENNLKGIVKIRVNHLGQIVQSNMNE